MSISWSDIVKQTTLISGPPADSLPVSLNKTKVHCRIPTDIDDDDNILSIYLKAAENMVETCAEITIREQTLKLELARWPSYTDYLILRLETKPVQLVSHIKYYDTTDNQQTLDPALYETWLNRNPPYIVIKGINIPCLSTERSKVVEILYTAGTPAGQPIDSKAELTILELVAFWYQNREAYGRLPTITDGAQGRVFMSLIDSLRWRAYP